MQSRYPSAVPALLKTVMVLLGLVLAVLLVVNHVGPRRVLSFLDGEPPQPPAPASEPAEPEPAPPAPTPAAPTPEAPRFPGPPIGQTLEFRFRDGRSRRGILQAVDGDEARIGIEHGSIVAPRDGLHMRTRIQLFEEDFDRYVAAWIEARAREAVAERVPAPAPEPAAAASRPAPPTVAAAGLEVGLVDVRADEQHSFFGIAYTTRYRLRVTNPGPGIWEGTLALHRDAGSAVRLRIPPRVSQEVVVESVMPAGSRQAVDLDVQRAGESTSLTVQAKMI